MTTKAELKAEIAKLKEDHTRLQQQLREARDNEAGRYSNSIELKLKRVLDVLYEALISTCDDEAIDGIEAARALLKDAMSLMVDAGAIAKIPTREDDPSSPHRMGLHVNQIVRALNDASTALDENGVSSALKMAKATVISLATYMVAAGALEQGAVPLGA